MMISAVAHNETSAREAFDRQSGIFDNFYKDNIIVQYKRKRVREHVARFLKPNSFILELNAGTGDDTLWLAQQGHHVHATDISAGMMEMLLKKVKEKNLSSMVTSEICSFNNLVQFQNKGPYDFIFSNFAGLNCTDKLNEVLQSFSSLLKPGGFVTLVILPKFCLWETLLALKGNFKTAFRRFKRNGTEAQIEGHRFTCWYHNPSYVIKHLKKDFESISLEGLCILVPPSYLDNFPKKFPALYQRLVSLENRLKHSYPWKNIGDYYIISLKKRN